MGGGSVRGAHVVRMNQLLEIFVSRPALRACLHCPIC